MSGYTFFFFQNLYMVTSLLNEAMTKVQIHISSTFHKKSDGEDGEILFD